jgi:predicted PurR-regulated permease PerM
MEKRHAQEIAADRRPDLPGDTLSGMIREDLAVAFRPILPKNRIPIGADTTETAPTREHAGAAAKAAPASVPAAWMPFDSSGMALGILAGLASIFALAWTQNFLVPLLLGIVIAYTLNPLVEWLVAIRIPRAIGTFVVLAGVLGAIGFGTYSLRGEMQTIIDQLPEAATRFAAGLARITTSQNDNLQTIQDAASKVEGATARATGHSVARNPSATHVIVDQPKFKLGDFLWKSSLGAIGAVGQALMVVFLVAFLLLGGDKFKRKLVRLSGPSLSRRKLTVRILDAVNGSIQKYMLMLLATNVLVGLMSWIAFHWLGLENAGAWAVVAGLLHIVPYIGPGVTAGATAMAAFMQFDSFSSALLVAGASLTIATFVGSFVTTWMTSRIARINPAVVFVSLLFWGWLWGVWGVLLSVPLIVILSVISQHVERLHPVAELLGD